MSETHEQKALPLDSPLAKEDICPRCLGELDTGWECNKCGYDAKAAATEKTND